MARRKIKNRYIEWIGIIVIVLALVRCAFPGVAVSYEKPKLIEEMPDYSQVVVSSRFLAEGEKPHRIYSVPNYRTAFPDGNDLQLEAAMKWGVKPVKDHDDAEKRMRELVYMGSSPYYHVDPLLRSIPYLVPRAAILLEDIGKAFFDSLQVKGIPLQRLVVSSVLRSEEDVRKLRNYNSNAMERSCHLYGTTFDIYYNSYRKVEDPDGPSRREVSNDSLKWVLSEVLRDLRDQNRCYIKYEVKQPCFHITVR